MEEGINLELARKTVVLDVRETLKIIDALDASSLVKAALKLELLTLVAIEDILALRWAHIHLEQAEALIAKDSRDWRRIALSRQAVEVLRALRKETGGEDFLFRKAGEEEILSQKELDPVLKNFPFDISMPMLRLHFGRQMLSRGWHLHAVNRHLGRGCQFGDVVERELMQAWADWSKS